LKSKNKKDMTILRAALSRLPTNPTSLARARLPTRAVASWRTLATAADADAGPVVKAIKKNIQIANERAFTEWQSEAEAICARATGDDAGISVARFDRPLDATRRRHDVVVTFRNRIVYEAWEASQEKREWIARGEALQCRVGDKTASLDDFVAVRVEGEPHLQKFLPQYVAIIGGLYPTLLFFQNILIPSLKNIPALGALPSSMFVFGQVMLITATMLKLSVPTSKTIMDFYLQPGGCSVGNTLVVIGGFASLVTGVCLLTGEVDGAALLAEVQAGNFWQWVVRPGG